MIKLVNRKEQTRKRHQRVRLKISGDAQWPRLAVYRSTKHIYAQVIDDVNGVTLVAASSVDMKLANGGNIEAATQAGVIVVNSPDGNTNAAAEHTLALMLAMSRNIPAAAAGFSLS